MCKWRMENTLKNNDRNWGNGSLKINTCFLQLYHLILALFSAEYKRCTFKTHTLSSFSMHQRLTF